KIDPLAEVLVAQQDFIGQLKDQKEEIVKNKKKVKTTHNQVAVENQQKSEMMLVLQLETNTQLNEEAPSQITTTMPDKIGKVKKVKVNNKQHVTGNIEIDRFDNNQLGIEEGLVADSREGQILY
ncbi:31477_t:CDS:2, partial [Gigaspora margarita]